MSGEHWRSFKPAACCVELHGASKAEVLAELVQQLVRGRVLARPRAAAAERALVDRERVASTGVGRGVAIPHVPLPGLERTALSLCVHRAGVPWDALDGQPVHVIFTVLRPERAGKEHDPSAHLERMRWISRVGLDQDFRRFALDAQGPDALIELLREHCERLDPPR
jgi:mannitol/fructose-specific phosphotransferase system IIA component (Ntr-type)